VRDELANAEAPQAVRDWIARAPGWLDVRPAHPGADDVAVARLDEGERAAIAPALAVKAELVLMDDREGVGIARGSRPCRHRHAGRARSCGPPRPDRSRGGVRASQRRPSTTGRDCSMHCWRGTPPGAAESDHATCGFQDRGGIPLRRPAVALHRHRHAHNCRQPHRSGRGWRFASVAPYPERSRSGGRGLQSRPAYHT
jgi:hypothetical protein